MNRRGERRLDAWYRFALTIASALHDIYEIRAIDTYIRKITHASRGVIRDATSKNVRSVVIRICA